jgi:hypothetical protein
MLLLNYARFLRRKGHKFKKNSSLMAIEPLERQYLPSTEQPGQ